MPAAHVYRVAALAGRATTIWPGHLFTPSGLSKSFGKLAWALISKGCCNNCGKSVIAPRIARNANRADNARARTFIVSAIISPIALEVRFDPRDRHSCDGIAIGKPSCPPSFNNLIERHRKGAAIELLVTSVDDTPIDRTTQRAVIRVITLADDFIPAEIDFTDIVRQFETPTSVGVNATD
jgi:hypothetical protein